MTKRKTDRHAHVLIGLVILLIAVFGRLWQMDDAPPGLQHDEIYNAEDSRELVKNGEFHLYYPNNQGREGGLIWVLGLSYELFGTTLVMIRFPSFAFGLVTVALLYRFAGEVYGRSVGGIAAGLAAVSFWAIYNSRVGLRSVMLPVMTLLVLWGLHRLCFHKPESSSRRWRLALLTGVVGGGAVYTYTSVVALYAAFGLFLAGLVVFDRVTLKRRWPELLLIVAVTVVITLPMINVRLNEPEGLHRVHTLTRPWDDFRRGNPDELIDNARKLAGMAAFTGDPEWRYNVADRPLFVLPVGLLVYGGLAVMVRRVQQFPLNGMLLGLIGFGLLPSLLTVAAPSFLRSIVILPGVMICAALAVHQIAQWLPRFTPSQWTWGIGAAVILTVAVTDWPMFFDTWASNDEVNAIYRDDLEQLADYLRDGDESLVFVSTSDDELDPLLYRYANPPGDQDVHVVFFDAFANIVLNDEPTLLFVSPLSPVSEAHADWLTPANGTAYVGQLHRHDGAVAYDIYRLSEQGHTLRDRLESASQWPVYLSPAGETPSLDMAEWHGVTGYPVNFGNVLRLVGVEVPRLEIHSTFDGVNNQLYFQPLVESQYLLLNVFVHLLTPEQEIVAQRDLLGVPSRYWHTDITFMQDNFVPFWDPVPPGRYILTMGVYNWATGERLPVLDQNGEPIADHLKLGVIDVIPRE
ncbi:MAG: glycosyltransferase family 39 protein [Anaerolineae bacterium]|nr:glycosyltransferase family 39 protein [Anaerolineae bacterium]